MSQSPSLGRRALLGCAALCGVSGPILSACSSDSTSDGADSSGSDSESSPSAEAGEALVAAADVPVGGGVALTDLQVVVTQPAEGEFTAYSGVCTHQGGAINRVEDGQMVCALHGSRFDAENGEVIEGPATNPLPEVAVKVTGGQVVRA